MSDNKTQAGFALLQQHLVLHYQFNNQLPTSANGMKL
jgi:hypothetical protein